MTEHEAVFNMAETVNIALHYPDAEAKNIFVRDDKKRNYYLITVKGDKKVNLKYFKEKYHTRSLSFASEQDLMAILGLQAGSVTPLGLINNTEHKVQFYLDQDFLDEPKLIGIHPNDNTATVWLKTDDLITLIEELRNRRA
ncbi:prolyl-tRNA synthetase associated domain-containing protein [Faucicola mancuniensis]|uniref:prolyl-tRNA synthetase associated domain-containing protein n=1 Tax=Faucicola mancuniensis TaxID=1309795 RepID=UPI00397729F8